MLLLPRSLPEDVVCFSPAGFLEVMHGNITMKISVNVTKINSFCRNAAFFPFLLFLPAISGIFVTLKFFS